MTITLDHSPISGTYVVVCDLDSWRHLTDDKTAAWEIAAQHEAETHPGITQARSAAFKHRQREAERRARYVAAYAERHGTEPRTLTEYEVAR